MSPFLERLNANLEKALSKKKKKSKAEACVENSLANVDAKVLFVKDGAVIEPDLAAKVKDFIFQVCSPLFSFSIEHSQMVVEKLLNHYLLC